MSKQKLQHAVNLANFYLKVHSAILYGLIEGDLPNQEKCFEWIEKGKNAGIVPDDNYIDPEFISMIRNPTSHVAAV